MKTQGANQDVVFLSGVRTGFGAFGGSLKDLSATELGAVAARTALERSGVPAGEIGHTVFGNALQTSADAIYLARHVGLNAGLSMAETAENLAERYKLTRRDVDEVALGSQQRAKKAWDDCVFQDEVIAVPVKSKKGQPAEFRADEHMRPETTLEVLLALKPYFKKDGLVTAGNASGIADGAAATVVASEAFAKARGLKPLGRLVAWAVAGVEPRYMGIGPAPAARKALQKAGMKLEQMDLVEVNEAFAPQYLAVERELGLDRARTNVHGGAIAIGHPLAASGTRITIHLLHALRQQRQRFGLGSACIGGGQGAAVIVEAYPA